MMQRMIPIYDASGTIHDHNIDINVQYSFSWDMKTTLNSDDNTISGEATISGTNSILDGAHPIRLEKVN